MKQVYEASQNHSKIGIIGGLGPLATVEFQKIFFNIFKARFNPKSDQEYPEMIVIQGCKTPDRTTHILDETKPDPTPDLQKSLSMLEQMGCSLIVIPCNTAHFFLDRLKKSEETEIVNIIKQAAIICKEKGYNSPLLLATAGTIKCGIYEKFFTEQGVKLMLPSQPNIDATMQVIYGKGGVKAGFVDENNQHRLAEIVKFYPEADCVILGCTELPLVAQKIEKPTIDPMCAAAVALIEIVAFNFKT